MRYAWPLALAVTALIPLAYPLRVPPAFAVMTGALLLIALVVMATDGWAGALAVYFIIRGVLTPAALAFETTAMFTFGLLYFVAARHIPRRWDGRLRDAIVIIGLLQAVQITIQTAGYDPLWLGWGRMPAGATPHGFLGNSNYTGAWYAITVAVVPTLLVPVWVVAAAMSKSLLAGIATGVVVLVRYRRSWWIAVPSGLVAVAAVLAWRGLSPVSAWHRYAVWWAVIQEWIRSGWTVLFGFGPGAWLRSAPVSSGMGAPPGTWAQAHNEYLQLGVEGGLVALALVAGWFLVHRRTLIASPWGLAIPAIAIESFGMFPFQVPALAVLCLTVLGLATRPEVPSP